MANKKDLTVEELRKMYEDALKESNTLGEMLKQKEKDEADKKKAQLALEKETRRAEVDAAFNAYSELLNKYIEDYGSYITTAKNDEWMFDKFWRSFF